MTEVLELKLVQTNFLTRWPCHLCDGCTEKVEILCEAENGFRVCERCLQEGGDLDAKLLARAEKFERDAAHNAAELRSYVGRLKVPSYSEWCAAVQVANLEAEAEAMRPMPAGGASDVSDDDIAF
jgi:hypothetical protein